MRGDKRLKRQFLKLDKLEGPLLVLSGVKDASFDEIVEITVSDEKRQGKVVAIDEERVIIQVFESTAGLSINNTAIKFTGNPLEITLSKNILGRVFNGIGQPKDGLGPVFGDAVRNINGMPINPVSRVYPRNYIQTGLSAIDGFTTLIRGQKLPIFSGSGLPHDRLAAQIVNQAKLSDKSDEKFAIVFCAIGIKHTDADFFRNAFIKTGVSGNVVMFMNLADEPIVERLATPRCALTAAEYLAFDLGMHILVVITDMTNYCEALRELSSSREEVPGRRGYPGYLYSDLASIYERAGMIKGSDGSITQIPILTMPNNDITHPIPDLTGYITEGQIVLSENLDKRGIYPPINILPSLSRLMKDGIGEGFTREDHSEVSNQIFSAYSKVQDIKALSQVIGEDELSEIDKKYLEFGKNFEEKLVKQRYDEDRNIILSLDLVWDIISVLPKEELERIKPETLNKYYRG